MNIQDDIRERITHDEKLIADHQGKETIPECTVGLAAHKHVILVLKDILDEDQARRGST